LSVTIFLACKIIPDLSHKFSLKRMEILSDAEYHYVYFIPEYYKEIPAG
jgi:hypothetical protein